MKKNDLEVLEYLVEYSDLLNDSTLELSEKVLFDGSTEDLDELEKQVFQDKVKQLLNPPCEGPYGRSCDKQTKIESQLVLACYQSGQFLCESCQQQDGMREAS